MVWKTIGFLGALLTMFAFFPQVAKIYKTKSSKDVSIVTIVQLLIGISCWIIYGIYLKDFIIIMANATSLTSLIWLLLLYFKYK